MPFRSGKSTAIPEEVQDYPSDEDDEVRGVDDINTDGGVEVSALSPSRKNQNGQEQDHPSTPISHDHTEASSPMSSGPGSSEKRGKISKRTKSFFSRRKKKKDVKLKNGESGERIDVGNDEYAIVSVMPKAPGAGPRPGSDPEERMNQEEEELDSVKEPPKALRKQKFSFVRILSMRKEKKKEKTDAVAAADEE